MEREGAKLKITPINFRDACQFVALHHRHHKPPQGHKFSIAVSDDGGVCGVAIIGRPVSRMADNGKTLEVVRLATSGARNACSMLYRATCRAASAMGYERVITYTLPEEGGASLRGSGFTHLGSAGGGSWSRPSRERTDKHPTQIKSKWEAKLI